MNHSCDFIEEAPKIKIYVTACFDEKIIINNNFFFLVFCLGFNIYP